MSRITTPASRLPYPFRDEEECVSRLRAIAARAVDWQAAASVAMPWVEAVRRNPPPFWALESLLQEYPISSPEGLALMRLAEAMLRVPDAGTATALASDQIGRAIPAPSHSGVPRASQHPLLASLSGTVISLANRMLPKGEERLGLVGRMGATTVVAATVRAIQLLGAQFVLGRCIEEAVAASRRARASQRTLRFSYDMLGEGARTDRDARRYLASYAEAIKLIARHQRFSDVERADGVSVKLSALFPRYEESQRERVLSELVPRVLQLAQLAADANVGLTLDAEESDRLELSLEVFEAVARAVSASSPHWKGFGLALQAYQTRALEVVDEVARIGRENGLRFMVRLVKGAYWDGEIKRAQELGLVGYPVFTSKAHTDLSYLACAESLLAKTDVIYPQFATHNAGTIAAVLQLGAARDAPFEMQRLHGMGEGVYREVRSAQGESTVPLRVYAPVGEHQDLLAYLVRRLLENGANSSFVQQLTNPEIPVAELLQSPMLAKRPWPGLLLPSDMFRSSEQAPERANSVGLDLNCRADRERVELAIASSAAAELPRAKAADAGTVTLAVERAFAAFSQWNATSVSCRSTTLRRAADLLESRLVEFCGLLTTEAGKTQGDCVAEVREAVDFCRYYALKAERCMVRQLLPGPTGETNELRLYGRGVFACISPWNFPLAIFIGQITAALVTGNTVIAKPAEQTPAVAALAVALLHEAGVPGDALILLHGAGNTTGDALVSDERLAGVCFTGSLAVAQTINRKLASRSGPIIPLIAETGGVNAMIVDSSALPEQVVDAVVQSSFRSSGQRCSALRLLCVHEAVADTIIEMIRGALAELKVGDPADFATDVGPLIDAAAQSTVLAHIERLRRGGARFVGEASAPSVVDRKWRYIPPIAFEVADIEDVRTEVFGPVLHIARWRGDIRGVVNRINALGFGLTLGVQTRIDGRATAVADAARVGNIYINRNMIGAVVGVQPFGGEGLSGTGPKAGGPHYLFRFCTERTITTNTTAAGGNAALLATSL